MRHLSAKYLFLNSRHANSQKPSINFFTDMQLQSSANINSSPQSVWFSPLTTGVTGKEARLFMNLQIAKKPNFMIFFCEFRGIFYLVWQRHKTKWFWKNVKPVGSVFAVFALIYLNNHLHHHHHVGAHVLFRPCHVHHHQYYRYHHVDAQVHHGQPGDVHRAADAVQADVRRHRPHWKVRKELTKNWAGQNMVGLDENSSSEGWGNFKASPTQEWKWFDALKYKRKQMQNYSGDRWRDKSTIVGQP